MVLSIVIAVFVSVFLMAFLAGYYIYTRSPKSHEAPPEGISETRVAQHKETVFKPAKEDLRIFAGKSADYYLTQWEFMEETGRIMSWSWPAALFSFFWMVHRKMYLHASVVFMIHVVIVIVGKIWAFYPIVILMTIVGMYGNFFYYVHAVKKIAALKSVSLPKTPLLHIMRYYREKRKTAWPELRPEMAAEPGLARRGGTNPWVPLYLTIREAIFLGGIILFDSFLLTGILIIYGLVGFFWLADEGLLPTKGMQHYPSLLHIVSIFLVSLFALTAIAYVLLKAAYSLVKRTTFRDFAGAIAFGAVEVIFFLIWLLLAYMMPSLPMLE